MGKWLGISHRVGSLVSYWVLTDNGTVVSRTTVSWVTNIESQTNENKARIAALDKAIQEFLNDEAHIIVEGGMGEPKDWSGYPFDSKTDFQEKLSHVVSNEYVTEANNYFYSDVYDDTYLRMEFALPKRVEPELQFACITERLCDANGLPIVKASDKPILDTLMYEVEYVESKKSAFYANLIE